MRILIFKGGSVSYDHEIFGEEIRINGERHIDEYPVTEENVKKHLGLKLSDLLKEEREFKQLQKEKKR